MEEELKPSGFRSESTSVFNPLEPKAVGATLENHLELAKDRFCYVPTIVGATLVLVWCFNPLGPKAMEFEF